METKMVTEDQKDAELILQSYNAFTRSVNVWRLLTSDVQVPLVKETTASLRKREEARELAEHRNRVAYLKEGRFDLFNLSLKATQAIITEGQRAHQFKSHTRAGYYNHG